MRELQAEKRREENAAKNAGKRIQIQEVDSDSDSEDEVPVKSAAPKRVQIQEVDSDSEDGAEPTRMPSQTQIQNATGKRIQIEEVEDDSDEDDDTKADSARAVASTTKRIHIEEVEDDSEEEEVHVGKSVDDANTDSSDEEVVVINKNSAQGSPKRVARTTGTGQASCHVSLVGGAQMLVSFICGSLHENILVSEYCIVREHYIPCTLAAHCLEQLKRIPSRIVRLTYMIHTRGGRGQGVQLPGTCGPRSLRLRNP